MLCTCVRIVSACPWLHACVSFDNYSQAGTEARRKGMCKFLHAKLTGQGRGSSLTCVGTSRVVFSENVTILKVFYLQ